MSDCSVTQLCPILWDPVDCSLPGSSDHGIFQVKILWVRCHFLLQGIFPTQGLNLYLSPAFQADSLPLSHRGRKPPLLHRPYKWGLLQVIFKKGSLSYSEVPAGGIQYEDGIFESSDILTLRGGLLWRCFLFALTPPIHLHCSLVSMKPSRTPSMEDFLCPPSLICWGRTSASTIFPAFQRTDLNSCYTGKAEDAETREGQPRNNSAALEQGPGSVSSDIHHNIFELLT